MAGNGVPSLLLVDARSIDHPTARQRGIGRHVTGLLQGLVEIEAPVVALCANGRQTELVADAVEGVEIDIWSPQTIRNRLGADAWYLATQLLLHPIALDPIPSVITQARLPVAALMYDVIPYRHPLEYLVDPNPRNQARLRSPLARTVDVMLANSEFVRETAATELSYPIERIRTVGVGVTPNFRPASVSPLPWPTRVLPISTDRYVVAVTGTDDRKNTEGLLRAWALLPPPIRRSTSLVVATGHTPAVLRSWQRWANEAGVTDEVVFTGHVTDDEMVALLQRAALSVFPSLDEGFGLPVVEAAACGCPVICSGVTSLPEVLDEPDACFDPTDPSAIADAIVRGLEEPAHRELLLEAGRRAVDRWSWPRVAADALEVLAELGPRWSQRIAEPRRRTAFAGAFTGSTSVLGEYNESIMAAIGDRVEHLVFVDGSDTPEPTHAGPDRWPIRALGPYVKPWDVDHIVAILGYSLQHVATSEVARTTPCHLWIHDDAVQGTVFGANLQALDIARSVIVASIEVAGRLRQATEHTFPVLLLSAETSVDDAATALVEWLADVDDLDPTTIRYR